MIKGYRTLIFNIAAAVVPTLEASGLTGLLSKDQLVWYVIFMVIANSALRFATTTPIGKADVVS
jgi:hypothetical protein